MKSKPFGRSLLAIPIILLLAFIPRDENPLEPVEKVYLHMDKPILCTGRYNLV